MTSIVDVDDITFEVTTTPALSGLWLAFAAVLLAVAGALAVTRAGPRRSTRTRPDLSVS